MKQCSKCKNKLPLIEFSKDKSAKDGKKGYCKSCVKVYKPTPKKLKEYAKNWNAKNPEKRKQIQENWYSKNPGYSSEWQKNERKVNPQYRIKFNLRERMRKALKGNWKQGKTVELLGLPILEYKEYLSKQFDKNMSWDNYGSYWEIDHIKPCDSFDLSNLEEQKKCFIFTNTQPMEVSKNRIKSNKQ